MTVPEVLHTETKVLPKITESFHHHTGLQFIYSITPSVMLGMTRVKIAGYVREDSRMHISVTLERKPRRKRYSTVKVDCRPEETGWDEDTMSKWIEEHIIPLVQRSGEFFQEDVIALLEPRTATSPNAPWP